MSGLSHEQVRFFNDTGYFKLNNVLNSAETTELRDFVTHLREIEHTRDQQGATLNALKFYGLFDRNPKLMFKLISHPNLMGPLQSILGPNIVYVKNRHNHATINDGLISNSEARLHRDILQPSRGLITTVIYLEDSDIDNGCTHIVPNSHNLPFVGVPQTDGGGTWMNEHQEYQGFLDQSLPVPMKAGSALLFNGLAFHSVGINTSGRTRTSMTLGFRSVDELERNPDFVRNILTTGSFIYRGNDRN